ncbi:MAG: GAF domain-containing protein [Chloroflexota bacterium]|nr:GAF domain-containing protein [Chloroflexota bacterium]
MPPRSFTFTDDISSAHMRHAVARLKAVGDISRAINSPLRPRTEVLGMIVSSAVELLNAELSWLGEFDGDSSRYSFAAATSRTDANPGDGLDPEFAGTFELGYGPVAQQLRHGEPVQLRDIDVDLAGAPSKPFERRAWSMRATLGRRGVHSVLVVPMLTHGRLIGFLGVGFKQARGFSSEDLDLLVTLADHSAVAIENGRLYQQERDRELQAQNVLEVTRAVSATLVLEEVLQQAANGLANAIGLPNCVIYLYESEERQFVAQQAVGHLPEGTTIERLRAQPIQQDHDPILNEVVDKRRHVVISEAETDPRLGSGSSVVATGKSALAVPFIAQEQLLGVAVMATYRRHFDFRPEQVTLAMSIAHSIALAIENARLYERTREITVAEERNRMAREIHDTLAQGLTGIVLQLEASEQILTEEPEAARGHILKAQTLARESLQEARRSVWNLLPGPLDNFPLDDALLREVQELGSSTATEASFGCNGERYGLSVEAQTCLLRVCQEALTNVRKHAQARHVNVALGWEENGVHLVIQDDGRGFDPKSHKARPAAAGSGGFGLISMRERCQLQHGTFQVSSTAGRGTRIEAFLPRGGS